MIPFIGINADVAEAKFLGERQSFSVLATAYVDCLVEAGAIPVCLPSCRDADGTVMTALLDRLDGVVLIGGADLNPETDGWKIHKSMQLMHPRREAFDRALVQRLRDQRMPVLGIGAGMQLLNVATGGTLYFDLNEDWPSKLIHRNPEDSANSHELLVSPNTFMSDAYTSPDGNKVSLMIRVTSQHHMGVDEVGSGFLISARAPDGVIEAIEAANLDDWLAIGVQFHPESCCNLTGRSIFDHFIRCVSSRRPALARSPAAPSADPRNFCHDAHSRAG